MELGMSERGSTAGARPQRTLRHAIGCVGIGLHSGARVALTLHPAPSDHGITFHRADRPGGPAIPARFDHVVDTTMCTSIGLTGGPRVAMVEHLMAALAACGIDNLVAELSGPEVPVMDGSAQPFVFLIECAGIEEQAPSRPVIEVLRPVSVRTPDAWAALEPADQLVIDCRIEFDHPLVGTQERAHVFRAESFKSEIAPARTFGFADAVEDLRSRGLALGGSLKNAVVVGAERILNEEGLRFADEFVRHKILDAVGDLYLAGAPIQGRYVGRRAGHALNNRLLRQLLADPTAWRWAPGTDPTGRTAEAAPLAVVAHG
jgi:UDP-3-O-[3-hydroxymyristoyl] N-acetylglucosamine deacetylase